MACFCDRAQNQENNKRACQIVSQSLSTRFCKPSAHHLLRLVELAEDHRTDIVNETRKQQVMEASIKGTIGFAHVLEQKDLSRQVVLDRVESVDLTSVMFPPMTFPRTSFFSPNGSNLEYEMPRLMRFPMEGIGSTLLTS